MIQIEPKQNVYSVLMEGIEAFAGLWRNPAVTGDDERRYATTADVTQLATTFPSFTIVATSTKYATNG